MVKRKHEDNDTTPAEAVPDRQVKKPRKSRSARARSSIGESRLELLPTEILQEIILKLDHEDYLVVKHVSKTVERAIRREDGTQLVDVRHEERGLIRRRAELFNTNPYFLFSPSMRELGEIYGKLQKIHNMKLVVENRTLKGKRVKDYKMLTCSICHRLKPNAVDGFSDGNFAISGKYVTGRKRIPCMRNHGDFGRRFALFKVHGKTMFRCWSCKTVHDHQHVKTGDDIGRALRFPPRKTFSRKYRVCIGCHDRMQRDGNGEELSRGTVTGGAWPVINSSKLGA